MLFELAENCRKKDQAAHCSGGNNLQYCKIPNLHSFCRVLYLFCVMCIRRRNSIHLNSILSLQEKGYFEFT